MTPDEIMMYSIGKKGALLGGCCHYSANFLGVKMKNDSPG